MTIDPIWVAIFFGMSALGLAVYTRQQLRLRPALPPSMADLARERDALNEKVQILAGTVDTLQGVIYRLQNDLQAAEKRIAFLENEVDIKRGAAITPAKKQPTPLLIVLGKDDALKVDLAALRAAIRDNPNWRIIRMVDGNPESLKSLLNGYRQSGNPIRYVHFAMHGNNPLLAPVWLSEQLAGVEVCVLMACSSDITARLIGVVSYVVGLREEITHEEAWSFSRVFWQAIAGGIAPDIAFYESLERIPPGVAEFAELHVNR